MKAVIQRVKHATVSINNTEYNAINYGMLILFCVEKEDSSEKVNWMAQKISSLRFFEDENGKMNKSIADINGEILIISQFTLAANCQKGTRPSFDNAEEPTKAKILYEEFVKKVQEIGLPVKTGQFAADMQVSLCNDGPVTFVLEK